jgi:hypothetical protein
VARVTPVDGWGYLESIDGQLASRFEVDVHQTGIEIGHGIRGWRGTVTTGKYLDATIAMTPRHVDWDGWVVANVKRDDELLFSGMAETSGLECNWK